MAVSLTDHAAERVRRFMAGRDGASALRLGVKKTGCSGFAYVLDYADQALADDVEFEDHGVRILVQRDNLPMVDGTRVDFVRDGLNQSFKFSNPNAKDECGCGESFNA